MLYQSDFSAPDVDSAPAKSGSISRESAGPEGAGARAGTARLDSNGKSTRGDSQRTGAERIIGRYRLQRHAAKILGWPAALSACEYARQKDHKTGRRAQVEVWRNASDERTWSRFVGLQTCKSVWNCPVCSNRRAWQRRGDLQKLIDWAEEQGFTLAMLTLTSQHDLATKLLDQRRMMGAAKAGMTGRAAWKNGAGKYMIGSVTATEVTHGERSGWHLHYHYIIVLDLRHLRTGRDDAARELAEAAWPAWRGAATKAGLYVNRAAFSVEVGGSVAAYPERIEKIEATWSLADEATRGAAKKSVGRHPFELLRLSCDEGDTAARERFVEYAGSMKGASALGWSRGLAELVGVKGDEADDEGGEQPDDTEIMREKVGTLGDSEWQGDAERPGVRSRRGRMSVAVVVAGAEGFEAERDNGLTDPHADGVGQVLAELVGHDEDDMDLIEPDDPEDPDPPPPGRDPNSHIVESKAAGGKPRRGAQGPRQGDSPSSGTAGQGRMSAQALARARGQGGFRKGGKKAAPIFTHSPDSHNKAPPGRRYG